MAIIKSIKSIARNYKAVFALSKKINYLEIFYLDAISVMIQKLIALN